MAVAAEPVKTGDLTYIPPWNQFVSDNQVFLLQTMKCFCPPIIQ